MAFFYFTLNNSHERFSKLFPPFFATAPRQEKMNLAQKSKRRGNRRPRSAEPLGRGRRTTRPHEKLAAVAPSAGASQTQLQRHSRAGKDDIDIAPSVATASRDLAARRAKEPQKAESSAAGVEPTGAGSLELPPMIDRLKTPALRGIEVL